MKKSDLKYFTRLEVENLRCFGTKQILDLSDGHGRPTQWNLILGDNGVGKTTLLEFLGWMRPEPANGDDQPEDVQPRIEDQIPPNMVRLVPALQNVEGNEFLEKLPKNAKTLLKLLAEVSQDRGLVGMTLEDRDSTTSDSVRTSPFPIVTTVEATFKSDGTLENFDSDGTIDIQNDEATIDNFGFPFIVVYGVFRHIGKENKDETRLEDPITGRLTDLNELYDVEQILQDLDYAVLKFRNKRDKSYLSEIKEMIVSVLHLESPANIHINPKKRRRDSKNPDGVTFDTFSGEVALSDLSIGYKTTLGWTFDLAWRLHEHYPQSDDPLKEPAIVIIDELDLHLHPKWQLRIMDDLARTFPRVQFIASAHGPLLVQADSTTNLAVIQKSNEEVVIRNDPYVVKNWRVDQILNSQLFGLKTTRDTKTENLFKEKYDLLDKPKLTASEKRRLREIDTKILQLPTSSHPGGRKTALDYIQGAAKILKDHGISPDDQD